MLPGERTILQMRSYSLLKVIIGGTKVPDVLTLAGKVVLTPLSPLATEPTCLFLLKRSLSDISLHSKQSRPVDIVDLSQIILILITNWLEDIKIWLRSSLQKPFS
jgi:hypothetical protein